MVVKWRQLLGGGMLLGAVWSLVSCLKSHSMGQADLRIDKGTYITFWSHYKARPVIEILGCTATIVSTDTVITAAHCMAAVTDSRFSKNNIYYTACIDTKEFTDQCTNQIQIPEEFFIRDAKGIDTRERDFRYDVAVLVFPDKPFKRFFSVAKDVVALGADILMVGYSEKEMTEKRSGHKRWGKNKVSQVDGQENTIISDISGGVAISPGDSGGPLLHNCKLVGVASRMLVDKAPKVSMHTNILSPRLRPFLLAAEAKNAHICGLGAMGDTFCPGSQEYRLDAKAKAEDFPCMSASGEGILSGIF
jgi:Trypsin